MIGKCCHCNGAIHSENTQLGTIKITGGRWISKIKHENDKVIRKANRLKYTSYFCNDVCLLEYINK